MIAIKELVYVLSSYLQNKEKVSANVLLPEFCKKLDDHEPFACGKIGGFELWAMRAAEFGYASQYEAVYEKLCNNAGFFSDNNDIGANLKAFSLTLKDALSNMDYLTRWEYDKEEYFIKKYCSRSLKDIDWLGVRYQEQPFGQVLKGRKVLAITPFADLAKSQYEKRGLIYEDKYLPVFELITYKAVQTIAGNTDPRFKNWFEALEQMKSDVEKLDFDIALVGCGAYSLPLCAAIKKSGRSAIHLGGDLQLIFGIMGKRWEDHHFISKIKNEHWVYPGASDIPQNANTVEDGCYW